MKFAPQRCGPRQSLAWRTYALLAVSLVFAVAPPTGSVSARAQGASPGGGSTSSAAPSKQTNNAKDSAATRSAASKPQRKRPRSSNASQSIVALVNDEPITGYEVQQRRRLMAMGSDVNSKAQAAFKRLIKDPKTTARLKALLDETIKANEGKSQEDVIKIFDGRKQAFGLSLQKQALKSARKSSLPSRKAALKQLVDERLKLQEAKRLNALASDADVNRAIAGMAKRNKVTVKQLTQNIARTGATIDAMKERIKASMSWNNVIRRRFGSQIQNATRGLNVMIANVEGSDDVELRIHRILLTMPTKLDQKQVAGRLRDAELMRAKFKDCKGTSSLATGIAGARFQNLGLRSPSSIPEPTRTLLLSARDDEMLPPSVGEGGVELWAVCGRKVVPAREKKRASAKSQLQQKEFEILAKRHLKDLRQDALVEYR
jgi:peptidyl-prolyl cis-trans isomerase SurA